MTPTPRPPRCQGRRGGREGVSGGLEMGGGSRVGSGGRGSHSPPELLKHFQTHC